MTQVKRTLWVDQLSRPIITTILLNSHLRRADRLMYHQCGAVARSWLQMLQHWGWLRHNVDQFEIRMGDKYTLEGRSLRMAYQKNLINIHRKVCDILWQKHDLATKWYRQESVPRVRLYLEEQLANEIQNAVQFTSYILWQMEQDQLVGSEPFEHVLILSRTGWGRELKPHLEKLGLTICLVPSRDDVSLLCWWSILRRVANTLRLVVRQVGKRLITGTIIPAQYLKTQARVPYKVSVFYTRSTDFSERNDLFWYEGSGLRPQDILVCFESSAYPVPNEDLVRLHKQGFEYVVRTPKAILDGNTQVWQHTPRLSVLRARSAGHALRLLPVALLGRARNWQWWQLIHLMDQVDRWQDFFESTGIRVDIRLSFDQVPQAIALDNLGGIAVSVQWSIWLRSHPQISVGSHVFFCWGKGYTDFTKGRPTHPEVLLLSGYLFDRYIKPARAQAQELRKQLAKTGAEFIVALFDERINEQMWPSKMLIHYYSSFLKECLQDPTFGLIIKSKSNDTFSQLTGLQSLLQAARATGRCYILEDQNQPRSSTRKNNPVFPMKAAMASDLAVSLLSTTGVEAALAGVPSVYYDTLRMPENLVYRCNGVGQSVFHDLDELLETIRKHRHTPGGLPGFGDHRPILDEIDPFRDGRAGELIGTYIRWFLDEMNAGRTRNEALTRANERYAALWGADKIVVHGSSCSTREDKNG